MERATPPQQESTPTSSVVSGDDVEEVVVVVKPTAQESALSNHVILRCIFDQLIRREGSTEAVLADIRSVRLVSEKWRDVMTRLYRKVRRPTRFAASLPQGDVVNPRAPINFLNIMSKSSLVPVQSYAFYATFFDDTASFRLFPRLLHAVEESMVSLELEVSPCQLKMFDVKKLVDVKLQVLETLSVNIVQHSADRRPLVSPIGMLLSSAPNLRDFKLSYRSTDDSVVEDQLGIHYLKTRTLEMICRRLPRSVRSLDISGLLLGERAASLLLGTGTRLTHLGLAIHPDPEPMQNVEALLASQDRTLTSLQVHGLSAVQRNGDLFHFPVLYELSSLTFEGLGAAPFSTSQTFPKLKTFDAYGMDIELFSSLVKQAPVAPSVKEIQLPYGFEEHPHLVRPLSIYFPAISNLYLELGSVSSDVLTTMRNLFTHLSNIEGLHLCLEIMQRGGGGHPTLNLDSLFSGIDERLCKRLRWGGRVDASTIQELVSNPSLLNMNRLKRLQVECRRMPASHGLIMTNMAADYVFLAMPSLKELIIPNTAFTVRCMRLMQEKFDIFSFQDDFVPWDGDDYSGEEEEQGDGGD